MTANLVSQTSSRNHDWINAKVKEIAAHESKDGCHHIEKTCPQCRITRITIMPPRGNPWHEWRLPNGKSVRSESVPVSCEAVTG